MMPPYSGTITPSCTFTPARVIIKDLPLHPLASGRLSIQPIPESAKAMNKLKDIFLSEYCTCSKCVMTGDYLRIYNDSETVKCDNCHRIIHISHADAVAYELGVTACSHDCFLEYKYASREERTNS